MKNKNFRSLGWCEVHHKQLYISRAVAKKVCRLHPGEHKTPFVCSDQRQLWHIGGLPTSIIAGKFTRDELYQGAA